MTVEIPRCKQSRWDAGEIIVCNTKLQQVEYDTPRGTDPGLARLLCPRCGTYCLIHMLLLPRGFSREVDRYHNLRGENGTQN